MQKKIDVPLSVDKKKLQFSLNQAIHSTAPVTVIRRLGIFLMNLSFGCRKWPGTTRIAFWTLTGWILRGKGSRRIIRKREMVRC
jgi:hypothetical protein